MTVDQPIFLSYLWSGWQFEFHVDYVEIVNPANHDRYRLQLVPYADVPILIQLIEKGTYR